jgi:ubiquinone/menaquinone biosynthesis C-methylase UbiE
MTVVNVHSKDLRSKSLDSRIVRRLNSADVEIVPTIPETPVAIPDYLREVYAWAYLNPLAVWLFDRPWVVSAILWGNNRRLQRALLAEIAPGDSVLQAACVHGDLSLHLADAVGPTGRLEVIDVAPIQVENCRRKLSRHGWATVRHADAARPGAGLHDVVVAYFLLHEMPDDYKRAVVAALLSSAVPGGKVVFIDYHRPHRLHPLKWISGLIFDWLEPFARSLWRHDIAFFAPRPEHYRWRTETYFGGLFQKTVAAPRL